jgi:hypothetical protein
MIHRGPPQRDLRLEVVRQLNLAHPSTGGDRPSRRGIEPRGRELVQGRIEQHPTRDDAPLLGAPLGGIVNP